MKYYLEFEEPIRLLDEEIHLKKSNLEKSSELTKEITPSKITFGFEGDATDAQVGK